MARIRLTPEIQAYLATGCAERDAEQAATQVADQGVSVLTLADSEYPELLRQIHDPPIVLYLTGDARLLSSPAIAIVGSRRCSVYGREVTMKLSGELAKRGLTIVSGLARGVDSKAHRGCLEVGGSTIAVLGNGLDVIYPKENRTLYRSISEKGCLVSEFPLGRFPAPQNFPIRNRIISGLCYGTLVTEASEFSGSLITARLTLEQGRELWAVPGNIVSGGSYGPNYLIKQGAAPVLTAQDVVDDLPVHVLARLSDKGSESRSRPDLTEAENRLLKLLKPDASIQFDRLMIESGLSVTELNQSLFQLEMKGLVVQSPGRLFSRRLL